MDTRNKLEEARYFLNALIRTRSVYNLSAFLSAWKSVLDVILYDFAEHYSIGLTREDRMLPHDFWIVAKANNNVQGLQFFKWWDKKRRVLSNNPLWNLRHIIVHRGYPEITSYRIYIAPSTSSGDTGFYISEIEEVPITIVTEAEFSEILDKCKEAFALMESIVDEAEKKFNIRL